LILAGIKDREVDVRRAALDAMLSIRPFPSASVPAVKAALAGETNEDVKRDLDRVIERGEQDKEYNASIKTGKQPATQKSAMPKDEAEKILQEQGVQMTDEELWHRVNDADAKVVQAMLSAGISPNSERQGMSVLMLAVSYYQGTPEQRQIIEALIDSGADVNYKGTNNVTPFFNAAGKCEPDLLQKMIKAGAVLEVKAAGGATTLTEAAMANKVENVRLLLKSGYKLKNEPSWLMQSTKDPEILAMLRKAGAK
jgi:hypothetical protein